MAVLMVLLLLGAFVSAGIGVLAVLMGDAPTGTTFAALACFAALLARIAQAGDQHDRLRPRA